jgi:hypothetical protein
VESKQRVVVGAQVFRQRLADGGVIELRHTETSSMSARSTPKPKSRRVNTSMTSITQ